MRWRRGALWVMASGVATLILALTGCFDDDSSKQASVPRCAPPLYEQVRNEESYPERVVTAARNGRFSLKHHRLELAPPVDWQQNPDDSSAFQGKLQDLTWIDPLIYAYRSGDREALAQARDLALDWIASNPFVNPYRTGRERGDPKPWIDKVSAARVQYIAYVTKAADCEGMLEADQRRTLFGSLEEHGSFLADPASYHETNHGLYANRGLYLLAELVPELEAADDWAELAVDRFTRTLRAHTVGGEGFWLEHSAAYQVSINRLVDRFFELTGTVDRGLTRVARRLDRTTAWVIEPDEQIVPLGDSPPLALTEEELDGAAAAEGLQWLPRSGLAFVKRRDPRAYLSVAATFHSSTHKDSDELSFDLFDRGRRIVSDSGIYHKDHDRWFEFQDSPEAHSTLVVDDFTPHPSEATPYGSGLEAAGEGDGWYAILARNPLLEARGVAHERLFVYRPGYALAVVDWVRSEEPHSYRRYVQLGPEIEVERSGDALALSAPELAATLTSSSSASEQRPTLTRGERRPLGGFVFEGFREATPRWTVGYEADGTDVDWVTTFGLEPDEPVSAELLDAPTSQSVGLRLLSGGVDLGNLVVSRSGDRLRVLAAPGVEGP
jgi:hypothetical protein